MSRRTVFFALLLLATLIAGAFSPPAKWGFFGHRRINRMAVFTLPPPMIVFFKKHIEYITEHAVDPDKRRYATKHEAVRHYIDIDHWGEYPYPEVPRDWTEALMKFTGLYLVSNRGDTIVMQRDTLGAGAGRLAMFTFRDSLSGRIVSVPASRYRQFFQDHVLPQYYEEEWLVDCDTLRMLFGNEQGGWDCRTAFAVDRFSGYGILPFHLLRMQRDLTEAFRQRNTNRILRLAAEMGHYIGDAHVPLHATENYNGQLSGQEGIHAFWESRLPELFADASYDFWVGPADYWENPRETFWEIVLASNALVDSVLLIEKQLSQTFSSDLQFCFEERLGQTVRIQCREYAQAYQEQLNGMVERRMRESILAIGSSWFTAWVDAGQPDLRRLLPSAPSQSEIVAQEELEVSYRQGESQGRRHDQ